MCCFPTRCCSPAKTLDCLASQTVMMHHPSAWLRTPEGDILKLVSISNNNNEDDDDDDNSGMLMLLSTVHKLRLHSRHDANDDRVCGALMILPPEITQIILSFLSWRELEQVRRVCRHWQSLSSHPVLWIPLIERRLAEDSNWPLQFERDLMQSGAGPLIIDYRRLFVETEARHSAMRGIWQRLEHHTSHELRGNLQPGCSRDDVLQFENELLSVLFPLCSAQYGLHIPFDLCSLLCIHNGELPLGPWEVDVGGILGETRLLSTQDILREVLSEMQHRKLECCQVYDAEMRVITEQQQKYMVFIPISACFGNRQLFVELRSHRVFLRSGWNLFQRADSLLEYFHCVLDSTMIKDIRTPPIPRRIHFTKM